MNRFGFRLKNLKYQTLHAFRLILHGSTTSTTEMDAKVEQIEIKIGNE